MNSEKIVIRERNAWEAIDSGILLLRRSRHVYGVWALTLLPCLFIAALPGYHNPWIGILVLWLLKPLLDRVLISGFGAALVGERLSRKDALCRAFAPAPFALLTELTWFRFVPWRLYILPVRILERQTGNAFRARRRLISSEWVWPATALRFFSVCVEWSAFFGTGMLLQWLFGSDFFIQNVQVEASLSALLLLVLYAAAMTLSESLHAASAFGLYINRRIQLEGWDIERSFTAMAKRVQEKYSRRFTDRPNTGAVRAPALLAALMTLISLGGPPAAAEQLPTPLPQELMQRTSRDTQAELQQELEAILSAPRFDRYEKAERWVWRGGSGGDWDVQLPEVSFLKSFSRSLARLLPWIALAVLLGALLLAASRYGRRWARSLLPRSSSPPSDSPNIQHHSVPPKKAPRRSYAGFGNKALREWKDGNRGEAVEHLYFGAVIKLEKLLGTTLPESATEEERYQIFARESKKIQEEKEWNADALLEVFRRITDIWIAWTYGEQLPTDDTFRSLCICWQEKDLR